MEIVDMKIIAQSNANIYQYGNADFVKYQSLIFLRIFINFQLFFKFTSSLFLMMIVISFLLKPLNVLFVIFSLLSGISIVPFADYTT